MIPAKKPGAARNSSGLPGKRQNAETCFPQTDRKGGFQDETQERTQPDVQPAAAGGCAGSPPAPPGGAGKVQPGAPRAGPHRMTGKNRRMPGVPLPCRPETALHPHKEETI